MPSNPALASPTYASSPVDRRGGPRRRALMAAVVLSLATHLAIGVYLLTTTFSMPPPEASRSDPPLDVDTLALPKPSPQKPAKTPHPSPSRSAAASAPPPVRVSSPPVHLALSTSTLSVTPSFTPGGNGLDAISVPNLSTPPVITDPAWLARPDADQVSRAYPEEAARRGIAGGVTLRCLVTARGQVTGCTVEAETPSHFAFGQAALGLTRYFRMKPRTEDGQPVDGATVRIPITFRLTDG